MPGIDVTAATIASTTSDRRPSLKFGTHSTILFILAPHHFSAFESRRTEVNGREVGNLAVISDIVNGNVGLLTCFDRSQALATPYGIRAVYSCRDKRFRRRHPHLRARERQYKLHIQGR